MEERKILRNEEGSVLVLGMLMLVLLSVLGISATTTSMIETQIAANERIYQETYYVADAGWKDAASWLDGRETPPSYVNGIGTFEVNNFGAGGDLLGSPLNNTFPDGTQDQIITLVRGANGQNIPINIPYWFRVAYVNNEPAPGSGPGVRRFFYNSTSNADRLQQVDVRLRKEYDVGY